MTSTIRVASVGAGSTRFSVLSRLLQSLPSEPALYKGVSVSLKASTTAPVTEI
jgi:hypothetical protein